LKTSELTSAQWKLLERVAKANEEHDEPPRIKGAMWTTAAALVKRGLLEAGARRCTDAGRARLMEKDSAQ
jgi:hypothetical protein